MAVVRYGLILKKIARRCSRDRNRCHLESVIQVNILVSQQRQKNRFRIKHPFKREFSSIDTNKIIQKINFLLITFKEKMERVWWAKEGVRIIFCMNFDYADS